MSDQRRYREDEVKEIFDAASRAGGVERSDSVDESGLTLAELQEVGREVGLEPSRIASAAAALEGTGATLPGRRLFGMPVSVARVVELPRGPTDREWELLVSELRATFGVGNLHALIEPTESGYRLRLGTLKGSSLALRAAGAGGIVLALLLGTIFLLQGRMEEMVGPLVFGFVGSAAITASVLTLPSWARERTRQMEHIAQRASALLAGEPQEGE